MSELKSNIEWKLWGKDDPLYAVSSWENKNKGGNSPWTEDDFYSLGALDWQDFREQWKQYGLNTQSCLEIGCGAGRITRQLAEAFEQVYAVDVSEDMIHYAQQAVKPGVEFSVIDGIHLPQPDSSVKAIFSTHVLQHLDDEEIGHAYFREFFRVLDEGGTLMIHLPLYAFPPGATQSMMRFLRNLHGLIGYRRAAINRRLGKKIMRGTSYSIPALSALLTNLGFKKIEFRIFYVKSNNDPHSFVLATK